MPMLTIGSEKLSFAIRNHIAQLIEKVIAKELKKLSIFLRKKSSGLFLKFMKIFLNSKMIKYKKPMILMLINRVTAGNLNRPVYFKEGVKNDRVINNLASPADHSFFKYKEYAIPIEIIILSRKMFRGRLFFFDIKI